jgi:hypothetical protein
MLDSLLITEVLADQKRRDIEGRIKREHLAEVVAIEAARPSGLRASAAAAIVRFGIMVDGTAGRRAAAAQHAAAAHHAATHHAATH